MKKVVFESALILGICFIYLLTGMLIQKSTRNQFDGFKPLPYEAAKVMPPVPVLPEIEDVGLHGMMYQWQYNGKGEFLYRCLGKSNIKIHIEEEVK